MGFHEEALIHPRYDYIYFSSQNPVQCNSTSYASFDGVFIDRENLLRAEFPLLLVQMIVFFLAARAAEIIFMPLTMPKHLTHAFGGMFLGPTGLGRIISFADPLQPYSGNYGLIMGEPNQIPLLLMSNFGYACFSFLLGLKTDLGIMKRAGKKAVAIAICTIIFPAICCMIAITLSFGEYQSMKQIGLPLGSKLASTSFIVVAVQLQELNMLTSKLGRLANSAAIASSITSSVLSFGSYMFYLFSSVQKGVVMTAVATGVGFIVLQYYAMNFMTRWIMKRTKPGEDISRSSFFALLMIITSGMVASDFVGVHVDFAPLLMGFFLPSGPPIGSTVARRLEGFVNGILIPVYLAAIGSRVDLFGMVDFDQPTPAFFLSLLGFVAKCVGAMLPCLYSKMPLQDAFLVALMLSTRGVSDFVAFEFWLALKTFSRECFTLMMVLTIVFGWAIAVVIKRIYKPSLQYLSYRRRTIQHTRSGNILRVVACIHSSDNATQLARIFDISNPTGENPVHAYVLHLVPLIGQTAAVLAPYWREGISKPPEYERIVAVFNLLERRHPRNLVALPYISMAPNTSMHDDVCLMALEKKAALILLPFHGSNVAHQNTCIKVLNYAPCSVGVLIDHGPASDTDFDNVGVVFISGPDDREALAFAMRIAECPNVSITIIRLRFQDDHRSSREKQLDDEALNEYCVMAAENERARYREEVVKDVPEMISVIREVTDEFSLMVVGRREGKRSQLTTVLDEWSEYPELGALGDMLASDDFKGKVSTLVLQQQARIAGQAQLI